MNWPFHPLGAVTKKIGSGSTPRGGESAYKTSGTPLIRSMNIHDGEFRPQGLAFIDNEQAKLLQNVTLESADVLINITGASVARCCILPEDYVGGRVNQHVAIIRPKPGLDSNFLCHFLTSVQTKQKLLGTAGGGATREALTKVQLEDFRIPLPPLDEQKRIASILDKADALRAKRHQAITLLDSLTQSIFLEMFGDPVSNPKGFEFVPLADLVDPRDRLNYGVVQPGDDVEGGVPLIRVSDLQRGMVDRSNLRLIDPRVSAKHSKSVLKGTEILISCVGSIGEIALASKADKGSNVARAVARVPLKADVSREFVATYLCTDSVQQYFTKELRTVSQPTLNIKQILETPVPLIAASDADRFESRLRSVRRTIYDAEVSNTYVRDFFASLQHRAFCGQL